MIEAATASMVLNRRFAGVATFDGSLLVQSVLKNTHTNKHYVESFEIVISINCQPGVG